MQQDILTVKRYPLQDISNVPKRKYKAVPNNKTILASSGSTETVKRSNLNRLPRRKRQSSVTLTYSSAKRFNRSLTVPKFIEQNQSHGFSWTLRKSAKKTIQLKAYPESILTKGNAAWNIEAVTKDDDYTSDEEVIYNGLAMAAHSLYEALEG